MGGGGAEVKALLSVLQGFGLENRRCLDMRRISLLSHRKRLVVSYIHFFISNLDSRFAANTFMVTST